MLAALAAPFSPFYSPPEEEAPRIRRTLAVAPAQVRLPGSVLFLVLKSQNDNFVVYEYNPPQAGRPLTVDTYWCLMTPAYMERQRKLGESNLLALNMLEEPAFGAETTHHAPTAEGRVCMNMKARPLRGRKFEVHLDAGGHPFLVGAVLGRRCRVRFAYVQMRLGPIPRVDYINLYGVCVEVGPRWGQELVEKMENPSFL